MDRAWAKAAELTGLIPEILKKGGPGLFIYVPHILIDKSNLLLWRRERGFLLRVGGLKFKLDPIVLFHCLDDRLKLRIFSIGVTENNDLLRVDRRQVVVYETIECRGGVRLFGPTKYPGGDDTFFQGEYKVGRVGH